MAQLPQIPVYNIQPTLTEWMKKKTYCQKSVTFQNIKNKGKILQVILEKWKIVQESKCVVSVIGSLHLRWQRKVFIIVT